MGRSGARPLLVDQQVALLNAGLTPVVPEYGSLGASGDLAPLAHCALVMIGEGHVAIDGSVTPSAEALAGAGIEPVVLRAKEGLALINGTDGILGMLVAGDHRPRGPRPPRRRDGGDERRSVARHRPRVRRRSAGAAAAGRAGRQRGQPAPPARRFGDRGQPPRGRSPGAGRLLVAVHAAGARRRARHHRPRPHDRRARARRGDRQPDDPARRAGRVVRQLPRRTARLRVRLPRDRGGGAVGDQRTPYRPAPRRHPLARSAAVPRARPWRQLGADDRPLHAGRDGDREQAPRRAGECRLVADERDAGGPRVDGVVGRPQAPPERSTTCAGCWPSSSCARRVAIDLRAPLAPAAGTGAAVDALRERVDGAGPDRWLSPELGAAEDLLRSGAVLDAVESAIGPLDVV